MTTWHLARVSDGTLIGTTIDTTTDDPPEVAPGSIPVRGVTDWKRQRYDIATGELVDLPGLSTYAEDLERSRRRSETLAAISTIEGRQSRAIRELAINPADEAARARLAALEAEITVLRLQMRGDV
jgi:hypothetical protein